MQDPLPDQTVLLAIAFTVIIVIGLIFLSKSTNQRIEPSIQWRDLPEQPTQGLQI